MKTPFTLNYSEQYYGKDLGAILTKIEGERSSIRESLLEHGVILLRGFPLRSAEDFGRFAAALDPEVAHYHGQTDRAQISGKVYESAPTPGAFDMKLHSETAYANYFPSRGFFYCVSPPSSGGETLFSDNRTMLNRLSKTILGKFKAKKVHYIRNIPPSKNIRVRILKAINSGIVKGWEEMFGTAVKSEVEAFCRERGLAFQWLGDHWLSLSCTLPATRIHRETGDEVWFNQAHVMHVSTKTQGPIISALNWVLNFGLMHSLFGVRFGDGTEMNSNELLEVRRTQQAEVTGVQWQRGDVAMFDNLLVAHGRTKFCGPRKLLSVFSGYQTGDLEQVQP